MTYGRGKKPAAAGLILRSLLCRREREIERKGERARARERDSGCHDDACPLRESARERETSVRCFAGERERESESEREREREREREWKVAASRGSYHPLLALQARERERERERARKSARARERGLFF